jgi:hypothetical protein
VPDFGPWLRCMTGSGIVQKSSLAASTKIFVDTTNAFVVSFVS